MLATEVIFGAVLSLIGIRKKARKINTSANSIGMDGDIVAMPAATTAAIYATKVIPAPIDASVRAFIEHAMAAGVTGRLQFSALWDVYQDTCAHYGLRPVSRRTFCLEINQLGLSKGQLDLRRNGRRYRPTYFVIPSWDEFQSRQMLKARLAGRAFCA